MQTFNLIVISVHERLFGRSSVVRWFTSADLSRDLMSQVNPSTKWSCPSPCREGYGF